MIAPLYKVLTSAEWAAFQKEGRFDGSAIDRRDGFIHLCAGDQVMGVVQRFFARESGLIIAAVEVPRDKRLKWETGADGCFPHFYDALERAWVLSADPVPDEPDQRALSLALIAI